MTRYNVLCLVSLRYNVIKSVMMLLDASISKHLCLKAVRMYIGSTWYSTVLLSPFQVSVVTEWDCDCLLNEDVQETKSVTHNTDSLLPKRLVLFPPLVHIEV